jgi:tetratricopeptide (TPR) repeat protein
MLGKELDLALADCNAALRKGPLTSEALNSRALVHLRRADFERAIADFKSSLKRQPRSAMTLYGLGLAQLRTGSRADGDRNLQAAVAIAPASLSSTHN